ncbi:MAG: FAD-dependent oxidoreductase [Actinomycetota bacterium]|nr:FAD-dependent oxidoreductase [Actinomycetota bacterium]
MSSYSKLSRRKFVQGAAGTVAATAGVATATRAAPASAAAVPSRWDKEVDVVVAGTGFAGLTAAITAAEAGASVVIIEKAPSADEGGNSKVSGQMWWTPKSGQADGALTYAKAMTYGTTPDDCLAALITEMTTLNAWVQRQTGATAQTISVFSPEHPGLPGSSAQQSYSIGTGNGLLYKPLRARVDALKIEVMYETPAQQLVQSATGDVVGVLSRRGGNPYYLRARKGVILACGGFEFDFEMQKNFMPAWPIYGRGTPYNTGDGIKMCQSAGAQLWHMTTSLAGFGALLLPKNMPGTNIPWVASLSMPSSAKSFIMIDKNGNRFMNERNPDRHGSGQKEYMLFFDGVNNADFTRIPWWTVFDADSINKGAFMNSAMAFTWFTAHASQTWSSDNHEAVDNGWILRANSISELVDKMRAVQSTTQASLHSTFPFTDRSTLTAASVQATIDKYNGYCTSGSDRDFGRPASGMAPIAKAPFYAMQNYPIAYNTQGGPKRNAKCQVVGLDNQPISHLYSAGEMGSYFGWLYNGGSNIAECLCSGQIAARNALAETSV